jgi:MarR family/Transcriptional regulator, AbiEi antitoxin, Type IV TA system
MVRRESHKSTLKQLPKRLVQLLDVEQGDLKMEVTHPGGRADAIVSYGKITFVCELRMTASSAAVLEAQNKLKKTKDEIGKKAVPILVVPYMGPVGERLCSELDLSWFDLSGNANIKAPGFRIRIEGKPNLYKKRGRPSSVFAPRSARVVRWLLVHPETRFDSEQLSLRAFAKEAQVDPGLTSRILNRLEEDGYVERNRNTGLIRVLDRDRLLDDWRTHYDFSKHALFKGHVAARSGEELLKRIGDGLIATGIDHAATGLGAASLYTRFATFRLVTFYVAEMPGDDVLKKLGFRETDQGANVWFVVPNDEGVLHNRGKGGDVFCADPVQVYLDLDAHPERASEMAPLLRRQTDVARRIRSYHYLEDILDDYRGEGISKEHIDFIWNTIHNGVGYQPPLHQWDDRKRKS